MAAKMTRKDKAIILHKYFLRAEQSKLLYEHVLKKYLDDTSNVTQDPMVFLNMDLWYGTLFVVVEGYKRFEFTDPELDSLITDEIYADLRKYRNSVFHVEDFYLSRKILGVINRSPDEIVKIHDRLGIFLSEEIDA